MHFLSVASGIEAASCAFGPLGWKARAFSEIAAFPSAVLKHRYPDVPNFGDMTRYAQWPDLAIDALFGGTPCQSYSVAGLRAGMDSPNGDLMLTYAAIAARYRPRWLGWENVPGVLSSDGGRAFGTLLGLLARLGYGFAYRILDAQYFGVPQRRRRVFVVGCLGDWRAAAAVLFERHGLTGNPAPGRRQGEGLAATLTANPRGRGGVRTEAQSLITQPFEIANCLTARMHKGMNSDVNEGQTPVIAYDMHGITSAANRSNPQAGDPCHTLHGRAGDSIVVGAPLGVRRLTPRECERLQGFEDDYTLVPFRSKPASDAARYKALGNSWAVPCAQWIGKRIAAVDMIKTEVKDSPCCPVS
jgi:DNA (cytosine-5)-methyltransferase 1